MVLVVAFESIAKQIEQEYADLMEQANALRRGYLGLTGKELPSSVDASAHNSDDGKAASPAETPRERTRSKMTAREKLLGAIESEDRPDGWTYDQVVTHWELNGVETKSKAPLRTAAAALREAKKIRSEYGKMWTWDSPHAPIPEFDPGEQPVERNFMSLTTLPDREVG